MIYQLSATFTKTQNCWRNNMILELGLKILFVILLIVVAIRIIKADQHKQDMLEKIIKDTKKENKDAR